MDIYKKVCYMVSENMINDWWGWSYWVLLVICYCQKRPLPTSVSTSFVNQDNIKWRDNVLFRVSQSLFMYYIYMLKYDDCKLYDFKFPLY